MQVLELNPVPPPTSDQARTAGVHLSDIMNARAVEMGWEEYRDEDESITEVRFALGFAWEIAIERALNQLYAERNPGRIVRIGEIELDGVMMTPDAMDVEDAALEEWKCTRLSSTFKPERYYRYITQQMCYCYALGITESRLRVLHLNGDYREVRHPVIKSWRFQFEERELASNWSGILGFAWKVGIL